MNIQRCIAALAMAVAMTAAPARAGRSCETQGPTAPAMSQGLTLAQRTHQALEAAYAQSGTQVVLLARAGRDLRKYGLRYSHMGIAFRTRSASGEPAWRVLHKLNACSSDTGDVYRQGLGEFFLDDMWKYEAAWVVPAPEVQRRLLRLLADDALATRLHERHYSMVSYAWGQRYQQSNQWTLETIALAMEPAVDSRLRAQAWLQLQGYEPSVLQLGPLTRLGGRMAGSNIAFDDHPSAKRFSDRIETVTVDSVFAWTRRSGLTGDVVRTN